jgi:hypothetical protein
LSYIKLLMSYDRDVLRTPRFPGAAARIICDSDIVDGLRERGNGTLRASEHGCTVGLG